MTGFEPAASSSRTRRATKLRYISILNCVFFWIRAGTSPERGAERLVVCANRSCVCRSLRMSLSLHSPTPMRAVGQTALHLDMELKNAPKVLVVWGGADGKCGAAPACGVRNAYARCSLRRISTATPFRTPCIRRRRRSCSKPKRGAERLVVCASRSCVCRSLRMSLSLHSPTQMHQPPLCKGRWHGVAVTEGLSTHLKMCQFIRTDIRDSQYIIICAYRFVNAFFGQKPPCGAILH